jgi:hypothetical protein
MINKFLNVNNARNQIFHITCHCGVPNAYYRPSFEMIQDSTKEWPVKENSAISNLLNDYKCKN